MKRMMRKMSTANLWMVLLVWCWMVSYANGYLIYKGDEKIMEPCKNKTALSHEQYQACNGSDVLKFIKRGNVDKVKMLLQYNAPKLLQFKDRIMKYDGYTPLLWAAEVNSSELVKILVHHNASVTYRSAKGYTALYISAGHRNKELVDLLLKKGANPNATPHGRYSALLQATWNNYPEIARTLLAHGGNPFPVTKGSEYSTLYLASKGGNVQLVKDFIKAGVEIDHRTSWNVTALLVATTYGHTEIVKALLEAGANPNQNDKFGYTSLHKAAYYGYTDIVKSLLEYGVNVNAVDSDKRTALFYSAREGHTEILSQLVRACPDDSIRDYKGKTALEETLSRVNRLNNKSGNYQEDKLRRLQDVIKILEGYSDSRCG